MAVTIPTQTNFNGGEISRRLHARSDLNLYDIAVAEMTGFAPLAEGGMDACPGLIRVEAANGPCRLIPFAYSTTQTYIVEASAGSARFYTNDARIEADGAPVAIELPYDKAAIDAVTWEQSYDVLYLYHPAHQTRALVRTGADGFELRPVVFTNGPFEARNRDQGLTVSASGVAGDVTLEASAPIFAAGDVGGLFQLEADDFGDIGAWEPGVTVTNGQLLTWSERVYRVAGGSGRTGTVAPVHGDGIEWDGIGQGKDLNNQNAGGVQLEYLCDRFGILRITGFTSATTVGATVLRRLPFTAATSYEYQGGYYDQDTQTYVPPEGAVSYVAGTWRWRFGSFSDRRGWPSCGAIWNERHVVARGATAFASVAGDLDNFATTNELGDISADMGFQRTLSDPNAIVGMVADTKLLLLTAAGVWAGGPDSAGQAIGPANFRVDPQSSEGAAPGRPVELDGRVLYVGKSRRRVLEAGYQVQRDRQDAIDLSRYARHIGAPRFTALASQKDPNRLVWALCADGTLAVATYLPDEQVLGWATRRLAPGLAARSIATIADPAGELDQLWVAVEATDGWHVCRMDQWRQEGDATDPAMTDLATQYEGAPATSFGPVPWLAGRTIQVEADGAAYRSVEVGADGRFVLPNPARRVSAGLAFPARVTTLPISGGSENGPAMGKTRRIARLVLNVLRARGLAVSVQGNTLRDIEQLLTDSTTNAGFEPDTGILMLEDTGEWDRFGQLTIERVAPVAATIRAIQPHVEVTK